MTRPGSFSSRSQALPIGLGVSNVFLPDSEIQFHLNWRNVHSIRLELYPIELVDEVSLHLETKQVNWIDTLHVQGRPTLRSWAKPVENESDHRPGSSQERLEKLPPGAYLLGRQSGWQGGPGSDSGIGVLARSQDPWK